MGTPIYMSPEQAMGLRGEEFDGRSDLYSLGIVMFQMLTGDLPLKANSDMGFALAHIQTPPLAIRDRRPDLPAPIADVVMKCLEKDPAQRPASARELKDLLERADPAAIRGTPREPEWTESPDEETSSRTAKPRRWLVLSVTAIVLVMFGLGGLYVYLRSKTTASPSLSHQTPSGTTPSTSGSGPSGDRLGPTETSTSANNKQVREAVTLGDFYRDRGEYGKAIREYENGLRQDPSNADLQDRLQRARNAKAAEAAEAR